MHAALALTLVGLLGLAGCTTETRGLSPSGEAGAEAKDGGPNGGRGGGPDGGVLAACPAPGQRQTRAVAELQDLALELAPFLFEGERLGDGRVSVLRVTRGLTGWEGLVLEPSDVISESEVNGRWVFGLSGPPYLRGPEPTARVAPIQSLNPRGPDAPAPQLPNDVTAVAVVEIESIPDPRFSRVNLVVRERLQGDISSRLYVNIDARLPGRPGVGPTRYLASFRSVNYVEAADANIGDLVDLRPDRPDARRAALASGPPPTLTASLQQSAQRWVRLAAWRLAPVVAGTEVIGQAEECTTGLGGSAERHRVVEELRGSGQLGLTTGIGGHGFFTRASCGDRARLALSGLTEEPASWACPGRCTVEYYPGQPVYDRVEPDEALWEEVPSAAVAPGPAALYERAVPTPPYALRPDGPWSLPQGLGFALAATRRAITFVVEDTFEVPGGAAIDVIVDPAGRAPTPARIFTPCPDRRLLESAGPFAGLTAPGLPAGFGIDVPTEFLIEGPIFQAERHRLLLTWVERHASDDLRRLARN